MAFSGSRPASVYASSSNLSPISYARLQWLNEAEDKGSSFLDRVGSGGKSALSWVFDKLVRTNYAMAEGLREHLDDTPGGFKEGFVEGITGRERTTFSDVLKQEGVLEGHGILRGLVGFGMDVALDPLTFTGIGAGVKVAGKGGAAALAIKKLDDAAFASYKSLDEARSAVAALENAGDTFKLRSSYAKFKRDTFGRPLDEELLAQKTMFSRAALDESKRTSEKFLQIQFRAPGIGTLATPTHIFGVRTPKSPKLYRALQDQTWLSKFPGVQQTANVVAKLFRDDLADPLHSTKITGRHIAEHLAKRDIESYQTLMSRFSGLSEDAKLKALFIYDGVRGVVNYRKLDKEKLKGFIDYRFGDEFDAPTRQMMSDYVESFHKIVDDLYEQEIKYGVKAGKNDFIGVTEGLNAVGYVPRYYNQAGESIAYRVRKSTVAAIPGFAKKRVRDLTLEDLHVLNQSGKLADDLGDDILEFNPDKLLLTRMRKSALARGNAVQLRLMEKTFGIPARVFDIKKAHRVTARLQDKIDKIEELDKRITQLHNLRVKNRKVTNEAMEKAPSKAAAKRIEQEFSGWLEGAAKKQQELIKERDRLNKQADFIEENWDRLMQKRNPEIEGKVTIGEASPDFYFHPEVAKSAERLRTVLLNDPALEKVYKTFTKVMQSWKIGVTSVNPGYRVRNTMSDLWNAFLSDVPLNAMVTYSAKSAKLLRLAKSGGTKIANGKIPTDAEQQALNTIFEMQSHGVLSGFFQGDVQKLSQTVKYGGTKKSIVTEGIRKPYKAPLQAGKLWIRIAQDINRNGENMTRMMHYLYRISKGHTPEKAAEFVRKAHFDYEDLTAVEQKVFKNIAPFYTWTRKNLPFQLESLATHPGKAAAIVKLGQSFESDEDTSQDILPDFLTKQLTSFKEGNLYINPQLATNDLRLLESPEQAAQLIGPQYQILATALTGRNPFLQKDIDSEGRREPFNPAIAGILKNIPMNPFGVEDTSRVTDYSTGERTTTTGVNPWVRYLFGLTPMTNYLAGLNPITQERSGTRGTIPILGDISGTDLSYLGGIGTYRLDQEQQEVIRRIQAEEAFQKHLQRLRDQGKLPPAEFPEPSVYQQNINNIIGSVYSRG